MRNSGTSSSITPLRRPFETFISENGDAYKSIGRWKSKFYLSSDDDYLSPSFLDDTCSLSSSPLFQDDTPNTLLSSSISPHGREHTRVKNRTSQENGFNSSNENTPFNTRSFRKFTSTGTPIFTSPLTKTAIHDDEGFLIPDLPGSSKRKISRNSRASNERSVDIYNNASTEPVHITMPPRLGLPSQTPLSIRDQYEKSPLPIVAANLDYRTVYMGDKLATRARDLRNRYEVLHSEMPSVAQECKHSNMRMHSSDCFYAQDPFVEEDYVLHHGELLRNRYSKHSRVRINNGNSNNRSRSLSSYYTGNILKYNQSPGYRSSSLAAKYPNRSSFVETYLQSKRRRIGSYVANNDNLLQQHIQLIDKSLERCAKDIDDVELSCLNKDYSKPSGICEKRDAVKSTNSDSSNREYMQLQSNKDDSISFSSINRISLKDTRSPPPEIDMSLSSPKDMSGGSLKKLISNKGNINFEHPFEVGEFRDSSSFVPEGNSFNEVNLDISVEETNLNSYQNIYETNSLSRYQELSPSSKSVSSLEDIVPHPIPCSLESSNLGVNNHHHLAEEIQPTSSDKINKDLKNTHNSKFKKNQSSNKSRRCPKNGNFNRKRHIDYHIPINQVKPQTTTQKQLLEDCSTLENSTRRYPKRLRTAPLKWYLGERLEYHRDEKNELGYTIAAIHKVANPKMLPNERGSIYPNDNDNRFSVVSITECVSQESEKDIEDVILNVDDVILNKKTIQDQVKVKKGQNKKRSLKAGQERKQSSKETSAKEFDSSNAVILRDNHTNENFSMMAVFDRNALCWADVECTPGKPYNVALSFISSQATCCEIRLPPQTEKGLDESQDNYILGHVFMAPDNNSLRIMISDDNIYNIGIGDWFLIPDNTNYNFSNTSDDSEIYISLYVIKDI